MVYGRDNNAQWGPRPPDTFDPEATQVVPGYPPQPHNGPPAPQPRPAQPYAPQPHAAQPYVPQPPEPAGPSRGILVLIAASAAALVVAGGVGVALLLNDPAPETDSTSPKAPATDARTPTEPSTPASSSNTAQVDIGARSTDSTPLTIAELFPGQSIAYGGGNYTIYGTEAASSCTKAADGQLATALATNGCNQVVRATVADPSAQYLVTIGVANLPTQKAADDVYELLQDPTRNGYFTRLSGTGPAKDFAASRDTVIGSLARGHYVIFAIGGRSGSTGASLADEQLKTALKNLRQYANETLTRRSR